MKIVPSIHAECSKPAATFFTYLYFKKADREEEEEEGKGWGGLKIKIKTFCNQLYINNEAKSYSYPQKKGNA